MSMQRSPRALLVLGLLLGSRAFVAVGQTSARDLSVPPGAPVETKAEFSTIGSDPWILTQAELEKLLPVDPWSYARVLGIPLPVGFEELVGGRSPDADLAPPSRLSLGIEKPEECATITIGPPGLTAREAEKAAAAAGPGGGDPQGGER